MDIKAKLEYDGKKTVVWLPMTHGRFGRAITIIGRDEGGLLHEFVACFNEEKIVKATLFGPLAVDSWLGVLLPSGRSLVLQGSWEDMEFLLTIVSIEYVAELREDWHKQHPGE